MSLAVWLGAERKCSATVVGLDMLLGLSMYLWGGGVVVQTLLDTLKLFYS